MKPLFCLIALGFIGGSLYTTIKCDDCQPFTAYKKSLSDAQLYLYETIRNERLQLYIRGLVIGLAIALLYISMYRNNFTESVNSCAFVAVVLTIQYFYYMLYPKSDYMLNHLENNEQSRNYLQVYRTMQYRYYLGFVMGMVGYYFLSYGILKE